LDAGAAARESPSGKIMSNLKLLPTGAA
jgi:hypothetical protein